MKKKILAGVLIIVAFIVTVYFIFNDRVKYNADASDLEWPNGAVLMVVQTGVTSDYLANYILTSDGEQRNLFSSDSVYEFLSPKRILLSGILLDDNNDIDNLYYIDDTGIVSIKNDFSSTFKQISLSPNQEYLYYEVKDKYCVSEYSLDGLGECVNLKEELSEWSSQRYSFDKEWLAEEDKIVITVRDREEHYEIPGEDPENMPPQRIQKEMGRYIYDPSLNSFEEISLDESVVMKYRGVFLEDSEKDLIQIFKGDEYKLIYDYKKEVLGVEEVSTGQKAQLMGASYMGDIPVFNVFYY